MVMDYLRSCYRSHMRLYTDRPDVLTAGRWYFCPPGARTLPLQHRFASQRWDTKFDTLDPDVGEVRGSLGWCSGSPPPEHTGRHYCGTPEAWLFGIPYADRPGFELGPGGVPTCCHPPAVYELALCFGLEQTAPPPLLELGWELEWGPDVEVYDLDLCFGLEWDPPPAMDLAWELEWDPDVEVYTVELAWELEYHYPAEGGTLELAFGLEWDPPSSRIAVSCGDCTEAPRTWRLTAAGFSGDSAVLNGTWSLEYSGSGCQWDSLAGADPSTAVWWEVFYDSTFGWLLAGNYATLNVFAVYETSGPFDCLGPENTLSFRSGENTTTPPDHLAITAV